MAHPARAWSILGNSQRLDGGAMFGNVPRALWSRWIAPDDAHRIPLACRALLVEESDGRRILFETGIGAFFEPKLRARFGVMESTHVLLEGVAALGLTDADIDVVVLSHLHFDHAGGLLTAWAPEATPALLFPNAQFLVSTRAWGRANSPHARDRASYIPALQPLLEASGRLNLVDGAHSDLLGPSYRLHYAEGHTPGLLLTEIASDDGPVLYASDLIPGRPWVHLPITMGYDRYPERLIDEKTALLADLASRDGRLFFTHDPDAAMSRVAVETSARGPRYGPGETWNSFAALAL
jgi:glyoxylase-like metal-dependent hydrolase (beta-lactamase superfamily II)